MKTSLYNFIFQENNNFYIYNSFVNSFAKINKDVAAFIENIESGKCPDIDESILAPLIKGGFIIKDNKDELAELKLRNRTSRYGATSFGITFAPTLNCNFKCKYCFENPQPQMASAETVDKVYDFVLKNLKGKTSFGVCWYGGEPLLAVDTIKKLSERFIPLCRTLNIPYDADIISNGYLMTEERAKMLSDLGVSFWQVTLDGPPEVHNERRPFVNGGATFSTILDNLTACYKYFDRVSVRINVDKSNYKNVRELLKILDDKGLKNKVNVYFGRVQAFGAVCKSVGSSCFSTEEFAEIESELNALTMEEGYDVDTRPRLVAGFCTADRINSFVIDPDGNLSKCWNCVGLENEKVGTVFDHELNDLYIQWLNFDPFQDTECSDCKFLPVCMGGCPYETVIKSEKECKTIKYNLNDQLKLRVKSLKEKKNEQQRDQEN